MAHYPNLQNGRPAARPAGSAAPLPADWALIGEVGLAGEVRAVSLMDRRLAECARMGFTHLVVPKGNLRALRLPEGLEVRGVATLREALALLF